MSGNHEERLLRASSSSKHDRVPRLPTRLWAHRVLSSRSEARRCRVREKRRSGAHDWAIGESRARIELVELLRSDEGLDLSIETRGYE